MSHKSLHRCDTCVSYIDHECHNLVAFVVEGFPSETRPPKLDDVCDDYFAEPDLLTDRLMKNLAIGMT